LAEIVVALMSYNNVKYHNVIDNATGWTVQGSNPGRGRRFFSSLKTPGLVLGQTQFSIHWLPELFPADKATEV
jgi:hypothetical protein